MVFAYVAISAICVIFTWSSKVPGIHAHPVNSNCDDIPIHPCRPLQNLPNCRSGFPCTDCIWIRTVKFSFAKSCWHILSSNMSIQSHSIGTFGNNRDCKKKELETLHHVVMIWSFVINVVMLSNDLINDN